MIEGKYDSAGYWVASEGSNFRSLTPEEVEDTRKMAESIKDFTKFFDGEHNATWEQHHPVAREVWEKLGVKHS
jgi:hypothetical protein